jgi:hypothetical protein
MKRHVWTFGTIAGLIVSAIMGIAMIIMKDNHGSSGSMVFGYASMIIAFIFIYVGIRNYRDKKQAGVISFGKAFKLGVLISLVASTYYVVMWALEFNLVMPDFMDRYSEIMIKEAQKNGADAATIQKTAAEMDHFKELYKNPLWFVLMTYAEIFPVGLLVSAISALILRRNTPRVVTA